MKMNWAKTALLLLIAAAIVVPFAAWAGSDNPASGSCPGHGKNMEQKINAEADHVTEKLGLTPAQRTLFVDMRTAEFKFHQLKRQSHNGAATVTEADLSAAHATAEKAKDAFVTSLNATQKQQWETLRAEFKGKMKHHECDHPATEAPAQPAQ
jgi:hypothetical protein